MANMTDMAEMTIEQATATYPGMVSPFLEGNRSGQRLVDNATEFANNVALEDLDYHRDSIRDWKRWAEKCVTQDRRPGWEVAVAHCDACLAFLDAQEAKWTRQVESRLKSLNVTVKRIAGVAHDWEREVTKALKADLAPARARLAQLETLALQNLKSEMDCNLDPEESRDSYANLWAYVLEYIRAGLDFLDQNGVLWFEVSCTECEDGKVDTQFPTDSRHYCEACAEDADRRLQGRMDA